MNQPGFGGSRHSRVSHFFFQTQKLPLLQWDFIHRKYHRNNSDTGWILSWGMGSIVWPRISLFFMNHWLLIAYIFTYYVHEISCSKKKLPMEFVSLKQPSWTNFFAFHGFLSQSWEPMNTLGVAPLPGFQWLNEGLVRDPRTWTCNNPGAHWHPGPPNEYQSWCLQHSESTSGGNRSPMFPETWHPAADPGCHKENMTIKKTWQFFVSLDVSLA